MDLQPTRANEDRLGMRMEGHAMACPYEVERGPIFRGAEHTCPFVVNPESAEIGIKAVMQQSGKHYELFHR